LHDVDFLSGQGKIGRKNGAYTEFAAPRPRILRLILTQPWRKRCFVQSALN